MNSILRRPTHHLRLNVLALYLPIGVVLTWLTISQMHQAQAPGARTGQPSQIDDPQASGRSGVREADAPSAWEKYWIAVGQADGTQ